MASLDIMLDVQGNDDVTELVNNLNKLEAQTKKMYRAFANGNITMREAKGSFTALAGGTNEYTRSMDRLIDSLNAQKVAQDKAADLRNYLDSQKFAVKALRDRIKANEDAEKAEERRNKKLDIEADKARRRYDPIYAATKKYEQALEDMSKAQTRAGMSQEAAAIATENLTKDYNQFVAAIKTGNMALIDGGNQFGVFGQKVYGARRRVQKFASSLGQQAGYQIQDFFVQIQSGQDVMVALGQQGSQLAGVFGTKGALFGAVIAIGTAIGGIAIAAYKARQGIENFKEALDELISTRQEMQGFIEILESGPRAIVDRYDLAIEKVKEYMRITAEAAMRDAQAQSKIRVAESSRFIKPTFGQNLGDQAIAELFDIDRQGGFGRFSQEQKALFEEYRKYALQVQEAEDPQGRADAFIALGGVLERLGVKAEDLPEKFADATTKLALYTLEYAENAKVVDRLTKALDDPFTTTENTDALRDRLFKERNDKIKAAEQALERAREKRRRAAVKASEREQGAITETEKLRRRLQERSTRIIQAAEKRHRDRRRKEEEEAARLEAEGRIKAQRDVQNRMGFYQGARTGMSRAAGVDVGPTRGDITDFNNALRIRSALETAYMQETIKREEDAQKRIMGHYMVYGKSRIEADKLAEADRLADLELRGRKEQELAEENARYEEEQNKLRKKAREEEERIAEARKRANEAASDANEIELARLSVLEAQVRYGKDSQQARSQEVLAARIIAEIQAARTTDDEELIRQAGELARQFVIQKHELQDAADASKALADELERSARAMTALGNVGDSVEMALVKATAQVAALSTGGDVGVAGRIAGLREENVRAMNEAIAAGGDMSSIMAEYSQTEADIDSLAAALERLAEARGKSGKSDAQKLAEDYKKYLESLNDELEIAEELKDVHGEEYALQRDLLLLKQKYGILVTTEDEKQIEATRRRIKKIEEEKALQEELADTISSSMGDAFMSIMDGTESAKDAFRDMADFIVKELFRILVMEQMVESIKGSILGPNIKEANGGVYRGGSRIAFAKGGVVGSPTYFPMSGGRTGLMGEAGPEAIMPLRRGPNGKLGVEASGGQSVVVNQSFNFSANGDDSVKRIIAQEAPKIADMTTATIMDQRRRGGAMRKAFN